MKGSFPSRKNQGRDHVLYELGKGKQLFMSMGGYAAPAKTLLILLEPLRILNSQF